MSESAREEFERVFRTLFGEAYMVAIRIVGNPGDAEEVAAEALARAFASWARLRGKPYLEAWVARVASNAAIDMVRRRRRDGGQLEEISLEAPQAQVLESVLARQLLARLPRRQREVLVLRYLADLTEEQVARCLGISSGAVKTHGHRGLTTLRQKIHDERGLE